MKRIPTQRIDADRIASHHYVCDLLRAQYPALSLYTDGRENWLYLWVDTDSARRHRFLLFTISREDLGRYLHREINLKQVMRRSSYLLVLDETPAVSRRTRVPKETVRRYLFKVADTGAVEEYLPTDESFFDPDLAPDIDLSKELLPEIYNVPITGTWFGRDFEYLFKRYERVYAFFYATRPRFVRTINATLHRVLRAPWKGGYSRVNLYTRLAEVLPAQHALRVAKLRFASPGDVKFEAVPSIGESIERVTVLYLKHETRLQECSKRIMRVLTAAGLNKRDLSDRTDESIRLGDERLSELKQATDTIGRVLGLPGEFQNLRDHAPNSVVFSKAVVSFVRQISRLAYLQEQGMLNFPVA